MSSDKFWQHIYCYGNSSSSSSTRGVQFSDMEIRNLQRYSIRRNQGRFKGSQEGGCPPPVKILPHPVDLPMEFMIKHNLSLVRGGSLWQYRSVPPSCNYGHPTAPPKCKPQNRHCDGITAFIITARIGQLESARRQTTVRSLNANYRLI